MTTTLAKLLEQKQELIERLQGDLGPEEREQIEQLLAKINKALDLLDGAGMSGSD
jgi:DNA-binding MarR family transcriptional regulator